MNILFIEDNHDFINYFKPLLGRFGEISHFKSSNGARKHLKETAAIYDLIICDHNILRFEEGSNKMAQGTEIYLYLRRFHKEIPFIHFSSDPCHLVIFIGILI